MEAFFDGGYGGGVWYCSYGGGHFYATSGGLITNNTAKKSGKDFVAQASFEADIHLASRLHDGTPVEWYQDPGASGWTDETIGDSPIPDLDKYVADWYAEESAPVGQSLALRSETTGSASDSYYDFFVVNNKATMEGGGIACNGTLTMGEDRDMTLTVKKVWKGKPETGYPTSVQVDVHRDGRYLETVTLSEENNWTVTLKDLPAADYTVKEQAVTGYAAAYAPDTADSGAPVITITNTYNSGGGGSHEDPDDDPRDDPDPEDIPDEPTPLTPGPEEPPVTPEEPVAELPEEEIPLVEIPKTGDISAAWLALTALSALGLAMVSLRKKREEA